MSSVRIVNAPLLGNALKADILGEDATEFTLLAANFNAFDNRPPLPDEEGTAFATGPFDEPAQAEPVERETNAQARARVERSLRSLNETKARINEQLVSVRHEIARLESGLVTAHERLALLTVNPREHSAEQRQRLDRLQAQKSRLLTRVGQWQKVIDEAQLKRDQLLQQERQLLSQQAFDRKQIRITGQLTTARQRVGRERAAVDEARARLQNAQEQPAAQRDQEAIDAARKQLSDAEARLEQALEVVQLLEQGFSNANQIQQAQKTIRAAREKQRELRSQIESLEISDFERIERAQHRVRMAEYRLRDENAKLRRLQVRQLTGIQSDIEDAQRDLARVTSAIGALEPRLNALPSDANQSERELARDRVDRLQREARRLRALIDKYRLERQSLPAELSAAQARRQRALEELQEAEQELAERRAEASTSEEPYVAGIRTLKRRAPYSACDVRSMGCYVEQHHTMLRTMRSIQSQLNAKRRRLALVAEHHDQWNKTIDEQRMVLDVLRRRVAAGLGDQPDSGLYELESIAGDRGTGV